MSETYSYNPDKLTNEARDTLRMELESITPAEKEVMNQIIGEYNERYIHWYGIDIANQLTNEQMQNVFIFTDLDKSEFVKAYLEGITINECDYIANNLGAAPFLTIELDDDVIVIGHFPRDQGNGLNDSNKDGESISEEEQFFIKCRTLISHEIAHVYGRFKLPITIREAGAQWYAERGVTLQGEKKFNLPNYKKLVEYYQSLLDKYGDKIHELFFSETLTERQKKLLDEIVAEEPQGLFDDFQRNNQ